MTTNRDHLGGFEERLLDELKSVVAQRRAEQSAARPARAPLGRRRRVVVVASAGALAIAAAVGLPLFGGSSTAPPASAAFELTTNADSTISVTIHRFDDADGLEAQLAEHGVPADVTYTPYGQHCQADRYEPSPTQHRVDLDYPNPAGVPLNVNDVELSVTLRPAEFQPDETLIIENKWAGEADPPKAGAVKLFQLVHVVTATGPVEPCELAAD
jgi:hypothetical protein